MILYTREEGGRFFRLPFKTSHAKILKQLRKNRQKCPSRTHIKGVGTVHSVLFLRGNALVKCWDAHRCGYRPFVLFKSAKISPSLFPTEHENNIATFTKTI